MRVREGIPLLLEVLKYPERAGGLELTRWDALVRQARVNRMLGTLAHSVRDTGGWSRIPPAPRRHLEWALRLSRTHCAELEWELSCIAEALRPLDTPVVLLKGAAYHVAGLKASAGRLFGDVDLLVERRALGAVEGALMRHGWMNAHHDPYDQRYYRQWMHELPPMQHIQRGTIVDVHHAILPPTARLKTDSRPLFDASVAVEGRPFRVLAREDMVLHGATHLFFSEGEMPHGCRDLVDLYHLVGTAADGEFWRRLQARAAELGLEEPLMLAAYFLDRVMGASLPREVQAWAADAFPGGMRGAVLRGALDSALAVRESHHRTLSGALKEGYLIVRGHRQKMPLPLLVRHLGRKAWIGVFPEKPRGGVDR
ncbi:nucleotidyltransferase domain-containing protein [Ectothiorhodospira mobilis]|uniref:nucleotidyltransferase domain-containing protein n=1 Tax=Ectothiorhodospira mobilis TaxID=195064 RepID=UPI0019074917|nr:nucleotidyltransferase family protein [Ectothiorhodospira mobilis]MBK1692161.1 hypothetical protein [Ectothiorhodospira mobilis]